MRPLVAIFWLVVGVCSASHTYSSSLQTETMEVRGWSAHTNEVFDAKPSSVPGVRGLRKTGTIITGASVAKGAIVLAVLFLLVRCASYLSSVSPISNRGVRSLAEKDSCEKVSNAHYSHVPVKGEILAVGVRDLLEYLLGTLHLLVLSRIAGLPCFSIPLFLTCCEVL